MTNKEELREIKFKNSDEDVKLLKAILDCRPVFYSEDDGETMTVESLNPIKELIKQIRNSDIERVEREIEQLTKKYSKKGNYDGNELHTAEDYYGISAENWNEVIRLEDGARSALSDVLSIIKQAHETIRN